MSLAQTAAAHTVIGNWGTWTDPNGHPPVNIATSCHFATIFWAFLDEFRRVPTQAEILRIGVAQTVITVSSNVAQGRTSPCWDP